MATASARSSNLLRFRFGLVDPHVTSRGGERGLPVRLCVGGPANVHLKLLLLLLRLQLRHVRLLRDDRLVGLGLGQRSLLRGELRCGVDLGLIAGLLDIGVAR